MLDNKTVLVIPTFCEVSTTLKYSHGAHPLVVLEPASDGKAYECPSPFADWLLSTGDFIKATNKKAPPKKTHGGDV